MEKPKICRKKILLYATLDECFLTSRNSLQIMVFEEAHFNFMFWHLAPAIENFSESNDCIILYYGGDCSDVPFWQVI